jgi:biotin operon repressor
MDKLAKVVGVASSTISKRIKEINRNGERVKYVKKSTYLKGSMVHFQSLLMSF